MDNLLPPGQTAPSAGDADVNPSRPSAVAAEKLEDRQTIEILRAVLRKSFGLEYASGSESHKPFLFILYSETGAAGDPDPRPRNPLGFPEIIRRGINRGSKDLSLRIVWVEDGCGIGGDPYGEYVPEEGAVVRFINLRREDANLARISGNIHRMGSEPRGFESVVEKKNGFWMVRSSYHQWIG